MAVAWGFLVGGLFLGLLTGRVHPVASLDISQTTWTAGQATFYPGAAQGGQCRYFGYYGNAVVAIGSEFWADGGACGACFELQCDPGNNGNPGVYSSSCKPGLPIIRVTLSDITDPCYGDRCGGTGYHFDLDPTKYADFANFASDGGGIVYIKWRRVPCDYAPRPVAVRMKEGINPYWLAFTILDQGGQGDVDHVDWSTASRGWSSAPRLASAGNTFTIGGYPAERISLRITTLRGDQLTLPACIPQGPQASKTYTCNSNFDTGGAPPASNPPPANPPPSNPPPSKSPPSGGSNLCAAQPGFPTQCFFNGEPGGRYVCCDTQGCNGFNPDQTPHCANYGYVPPNYGGAAAPGPASNPPASSPPSGAQGVCGTGAATSFPTRCYFNSDRAGRYVCCDNQGCDGFNADNLTPHCKTYGYVPPRFGV